MGKRGKRWYKGREENGPKNRAGEKQCNSIGRYMFSKTMEMDNKPINLWSFVMSHFMGEN